MTKVLTVSQINTYIKSLIDGSEILSHVYISGEISNLTDHYRSGHIYLSLKDDKSVLKAVMFATSAKRLRFSPKDGMKVLVRGRISVYEQSGQYQLYIEDMQPDGVGALNLAFEQLKDKLLGEGLFSPERKKQLPPYPQKIGVITSPTGAAVQDIIRILGRRWPVAEVLLYPCTVQGEKAVQELVTAVKDINEQGTADVIIIGRGGGSIEDLWAFNSEELARELARSKIPTVSAVGHETDYTICDFVSDLRASTPSAAAELVTPSIDEETGKVLYAQKRMKSAAQQALASAFQRLDGLPQINVLLKKRLDKQRERLESLSRELELISDKRLLTEKVRLEALAGKLDALSPLKVLSRGYSVIMRDEKVINGIDSVNIGDTLTAVLNDGELSLKVLCKEKNT